MSGQSVSSSSIGGHNIQIGRVDGDLTLLLDRPDYRLEVLAPRAVQHVPRSRRTPSYLLDARQEVVPYRPRPDVEERVRWWLEDDDEPASLLLVHGPGGQGKTRLAGHIATDAHRRGWAVAQAVTRPRPVSEFSERGAAVGAPLLVVVDYAERWPLPVLVEMVEQVLVDHPDRRVRVLLLARPHRGFWEGVRAELSRTAFDLPDPLSLAGLESQDVSTAFHNAAAAFHLHLTSRSYQPTATPAGLREGDAALTVHMLALATVCALLGDVPVPDRDDLSVFLLDHERRFWEADATDTAVIGDMVFLASLFGPLADGQRARSWLQAARLADGPAAAEHLLKTHHRLYPADTPHDQAGPQVLAPLRPDRFAEDFINHHLQHPHAPELAADLFQHTEDTEARQGLIMLAAAAGRHASARALLLDLLTARPSLARHASAPVITTVITHATHDQAAAIHDALPRYSTELLRPARDLAQHITTTLPPGATPATRAHHLTWLGIRLAEAGDIRAALDTTREATGIYRTLAEAEPNTYLPKLATSLNNLGVRLSEVGDKRAALDTTREATSIYRTLAEAEPNTYLPKLAMSLNNLGNHLANMGDHRAALDTAREAVAIRRTLAEAEPNTYLPKLAMSLNNLGNRLSEVGDHRAALDTAREAVEIRRTLAEAEPNTYLPDLAVSLNNLGMSLSEVGDVRSALDLTREATSICRTLAETEPAAHLPRLALSLWTYAWVREAPDLELDQALEAMTEAIKIYEELAQLLPETFTGYLEAANDTRRRLLDKSRNETPADSDE